VAAVAATRERLVVTSKDGATYVWNLRTDGTPASEEPMHVDTPAAGPRRQWQSACLLPNGKIVRLASRWARGKGGASALSSELLI